MAKGSRAKDEVQKTSLLFKSLTKTLGEARSSNASLIAKRIKIKFKNMYSELLMQVEELELKHESMLNSDLGLQSVTSTEVIPKDFDPTKWIEELVNGKITLLDYEVQATAIKATYLELFGEVLESGEAETAAE